jgi:hypothetical protein
MLRVSLGPMFRLICSLTVADRGGSAGPDAETTLTSNSI